jgi:hypothetical protein
MRQGNHRTYSTLGVLMRSVTICLEMTFMKLSVLRQTTIKSKFENLIGSEHL